MFPKKFNKHAAFTTEKIFEYTKLLSCIDATFQGNMQQLSIGLHT
jgi:hypothetical protein